MTDYVTNIIERSDELMDALFDQWTKEYLEWHGIKLAPTLKEE